VEIVMDRNRLPLLAPGLIVVALLAGLAAVPSTEPAQVPKGALEPENANEARLNGLQPDRVCRLGMIRTWQKVRPLAKMTVVDNVMVGALVRTTSLKVAREVAHEQLNIVRMDHRSSMMAGGLPIGERKKLEIARALATKPEMVLLDEVMGGLNTGEKEEIILLILDLKKRGFTQVVIEHDMKAIMRISDRVVVLNSGEKLTEGTPREVADNPEVIAAYLGERAEG